MRPADDPINAVAAQQFGVFSRDQALGLGATSRLISSRVASGRWVRVAPCVYSLPGHPDSWRRQLWTAYLSAGPTAVVGFESAGSIHECHGVPDGRISLIVDRPRRHANGAATWHRLDDLDPTHVTELDGLRITTLDRTVVDLAAVFRRGRLAELVEDLIVGRRTSAASIGHVLDQVRRSGKPGVRRLCDVLDALGPGAPLAHSELEKLLDGAIDLSGLPRPEHEHPLPSVRAPLGFVDRIYPEAALILEADGRKWHERRRNQTLDNLRDIEAARNGHQTMRLTWEYLTADPEDAAAAICDVYELRVDPAHPRVARRRRFRGRRRPDPGRE